MKYQKDLCIVLSRINYKDNDRILTVLGKSLGKQKMLAKGVRKEKSKLSGGVELLSVSELNWVAKPGSDFGVLTGTQMRYFYGDIAKDYAAIEVVFRWMKLIDKLSDDGQGQEYFGILELGLRAVAGEKIDAQCVDIWLKLQILHASGYEINWDNIDLLRASRSFFLFDYDLNQFVTSPNGVFDLAVLKILRFYQTTKTLSALDADPRHIVGASQLLSEIIKKIV